MRIRSIGLERYGAFEARRVELGRGLTLVVGANEAGKSTTLDALSDLLWGFRRGAQTFDFGASMLSLTARLELTGAASAADHGVDDVRRGETDPEADRAGSAEPGEVEVRRRGPHMVTVPDGAELVPRWGAGGAEAHQRWREAFGLSHQGLRAGGDAVFGGGGDLAELVFTARSGRAVRGLVDKLAAEMDAHYKPHRNARKNVRLRAALADHERYSGQAASLMTRAADVDEAARVRDLRRAEAERTAARLASAIDRHRHLDQWLRAAPRIRELVGLRERRAALLAAGRVPTAEQIAGFERGHAALGAAEAELTRLAGELADRRAARAALRVDSEILADEEAIGRLARVAEARHDDERRARERSIDAQRLLDEARARLRELVGPGGDDRPVETLLAELHVPADLAAQLDGLADTVTTRLDELARAHDTLEAARRRHQEYVGVGSDLEASAVGLVREVLVGIRAHGSPTELTRQAVEDAATATRDRREALRRAGARDIDGGPPAVPTRAIVRAARDRLRTAQTDLGRCEVEVADAERELDAAEDRLAEAEGAHLPDQAALERARANREDLWERLTSAASAGAGMSRERAEELLPVLAATIGRADEVADQLIHHADLAARREQLGRDVDDARARHEAAIDARAAAADADEDALRAWETLWAGLGVAVPGIEEADEVRRALDDAQRAQTALVAAEQRLDRLAGQSEAQRVTLVEALAQVGRPRPDADLATLLAAADAVLAADDAARDARANERHHARAAGEAEQVRDAHAARLRAAEADWATVVREAGLSGGLLPAGWAERRSILADATSLHEEAKRAEREAADARIRHTEFAAEVRTLAARHPEKADGRSPEDAEGRLREELDLLVTRRDTAVAARAQASEIDRSVAKLDARLAAAATQRDEAVAHLVELRAAVGLGAADDTAGGAALVEAVERGRAMIEINSTMRDAERVIRAAAPDDELDTLVKELAERTDDDLGAELAAAQDERDRCAAANDEARTAVGEISERLRRMRDGASAGELHARAQEALARVAESAERYLITRIQYETLKSQLESYERRHASPLLAEAGRLLERLTEGRYVALRPVDRGDGHRTLRVIRADEQELGPGELSEGTADQVFLALRLAAIDQLQVERVERGAPTLPVVLDDVLMTFDDDRAGAALRVLADLARRWQIIVLSHHEHLADIADGIARELDATEQEPVMVCHLPGANRFERSRDPEQIRSLTALPDGTGGSGGGGPEHVSRPASGTVRNWARAQGYEVGDRGRIPAEVLDAFGRAHAS